ncbi:hypothetical protein BU15DRAFT_64824 [Melanogaster broomeanus]|nr:hypothetical protein BU15DRAFT_64824 [Melanogaster broomeanus]
MKFFSPLVLAGLFASTIAAPVGNGISINLRDLEANESQLNKRDLVYVYLLGIYLNIRDTETVDAELSKRSEDYTLVIPSLTPGKRDIGARSTDAYEGRRMFVSMRFSVLCISRVADEMAQGLEAQGVPQDQFSQYLSQALQVTDPETGNGYQLIPDSSSTSPGPDDIGLIMGYEFPKMNFRHLSQTNRVVANLKLVFGINANSGWGDGRIVLCPLTSTILTFTTRTASSTSSHLELESCTATTRVFGEPPALAGIKCC